MTNTTPFRLLTTLDKITFIGAYVLMVGAVVGTFIVILL